MGDLERVAADGGADEGRGADRLQDPDLGEGGGARVLLDDVAVAEQVAAGRLEAFPAVGVDESALSGPRREVRERRGCRAGRPGAECRACRECESGQRSAGPGQGRSVELPHG